MQKPLNLGVLISGGGRTLQNLIDRIGDGSLRARVQIVISSHPEAFGLERAKKHKIPSVVINRGSFKGKSALGGFSQAITEELGKYKLDLVVMAGFNCLYRIPERYKGRVMNIHPALIPAFCGKGYYGEKVHRSVLEYGAKVTGCTVHFADNSYDHGPIILQHTVPVLDSDTPESLAEKVFEEECEAYPEAISLFQKGLLKIEGRRVRILLPPITPKVPAKKPVKSRTTFAGTCRQKLRECVPIKEGDPYAFIINFQEVREGLGCDDLELPNSRICSIFRREGYRVGSLKDKPWEPVVIIFRDESVALEWDALLKAKKEGTEGDKKQGE